MKTVIGIVGEKGSGKETFVNLLKGCLPTTTISHIRSVDVLYETLKIWNITPTRKNLQHLSVAMDECLGSGALTRAVTYRMNEARSEVIIFDGVRWKSDQEMIRSFPHNFLVYIHAPLEIRFERTKARKEKAGERNTTFEKFKEEESAPTEVEIGNIGATADVTMENSGTIEEFEKQVQEFCSIHFK